MQLGRKNRVFFRIIKIIFIILQCFAGTMIDYMMGHIRKWQIPAKLSVEY